MQDNRTPLHWAASGGHLDAITYLLANGAEVDKADDSGWTALHIAGGRDRPRARFSDEMSWILVSAGQEEVVRELVGTGADVNRKNDKGITPLFVSRIPSFSVSDASHGHPLDTMLRQSHASKSEPLSTLSTGTTVLIFFRSVAF